MLTIYSSVSRSSKRSVKRLHSSSHYRKNGIFASYSMLLVHQNLDTNMLSSRLKIQIAWSCTRLVAMIFHVTLRYQRISNNWTRLFDITKLSRYCFGWPGNIKTFNQMTSDKANQEAFKDILCSWKVSAELFQKLTCYTYLPSTLNNYVNKLSMT